MKNFCRLPQASCGFWGLVLAVSSLFGGAMFWLTSQMHVDFRMILLMGLAPVVYIAAVLAQWLMKCRAGGFTRHVSAAGIGVLFYCGGVLTWVLSTDGAIWAIGLIGALTALVLIPYVHAVKGHGQARRSQQNGGYPFVGHRL